VVPFDRGATAAVVTVSNGIGIVAERAGYFPVGGSQAMAAMTPEALAAALADGRALAAAPAGLSFNPYATGWGRRTPPTLYQGLIGLEGRAVVVGADGTRATATDTGPPGPATSAASSDTGLLTATPMSVSVPWYGAHLTGGRRQ
jgi:hypothetical protein